MLLMSDKHSDYTNFKKERQFLPTHGQTNRIKKVTLKRKNEYDIFRQNKRIN